MKKILLIEDDEMMRENTAEILELAQFNVTTAADGKIGSKLAKEIIPDLIVSDIMMPGLDGYGVLHILSKDPKTANIPFIFLTAKAEKSEWRKGMELGADDYITKPFDDTELLNAIEIRLKKSAARKKEFERSEVGLDSFFEEVKSIKELKDLSLNRPKAAYKKKEIIYHDGDKPHYVYFINSGKVKIYKTHDDGKEYITQVLKSGDFFGHTAMFYESNYNDSALVLESSEIIKIPKEDFMALIFQNRDVAGQFIKMLSNQVEEQEEQLIKLAYDTVRKRTADALLNLKNQYKADSPDGAIVVTRENLASMVGTATETVIRCLGEFKEDGFIEVNGRSIKVLDEKGLNSVQ